MGWSIRIVLTQEEPSSDLGMGFKGDFKIQEQPSQRVTRSFPWSAFKAPMEFRAWAGNTCWANPFHVQLWNKNIGLG